jgi:hypothetical protein
MSIGPPTRDLFLSPTALHHGDACHFATVKQVVVSLGMSPTRSITRCSTTHISGEEFNCVMLISLPLLNMCFSLCTDRSIIIGITGFLKQEERKR